MGSGSDEDLAVFRAEERDECQATLRAAGGIRGGGVFRSAGLRPVCDLRRGVDACRGGGGRGAFAGANGRAARLLDDDDAFGDAIDVFGSDRFVDEGVGARVDESPDVGFLRDGGGVIQVGSDGTDGCDAHEGG